MDKPHRTQLGHLSNSSSALHAHMLYQGIVDLECNAMHTSCQANPRSVMMLVYVSICESMILGNGKGFGV